jgi:glycosyltransferase involved in cell wall biosynthesis
VVNSFPAVGQDGTAGAARARLGLSSDSRVVVVVGRLEQRKGHELLLRALPDVKAAVPGLLVLVCGLAPYGSGYDRVLQQLCADLDLDDVVRFCGFRRDIPLLLRASDLFCLPTEQDACPLAFLEAMQAGLPTVGLYSGGVPEIVADGTTGLLSYPGDVRQLSTNLVALLTDDDQRRAMGRAGFERLVNRFDPTTLSVRWVDALRRAGRA